METVSIIFTITEQISPFNLGFLFSGLKAYFMKWPIKNLAGTL